MVEFFFLILTSFLGENPGKINFFKRTFDPPLEGLPLPILGWRYPGAHRGAREGGGCEISGCTKVVQIELKPNRIDPIRSIIPKFTIVKGIRALDVHQNSLLCNLRFIPRIPEPSDLKSLYNSRLFHQSSFRLYPRTNNNILLPSPNWLCHKDIRPSTTI